MIRDCSLHATQATSPLSASVIVGQYGPAACARANGGRIRDTASGGPPASGTPAASIAPMHECDELHHAFDNFDEFALV